MLHPLFLLLLSHPCLAPKRAQHATHDPHPHRHHHHSTTPFQAGIQHGAGRGVPGAQPGGAL